MGAGLAGLGFRAYHLQVHSAKSFEDRALQNQTRLEVVAAPRGRFLDRRSRVIVENRDSVDVLLVDPRHAPEGKDLERLSWVLGLPEPELRRRLPRRRTVGYYLPSVLKEGVGQRTYVRLLEDKIHLPSVVPRELSVRHYLYETLACHLLGRVGRIGPEEEERYSDEGYSPDAMIGVAGLERAYEARLRGRDGIRALRVDALGWPVGERLVSPPESGQDVCLTLDLEVQLEMERALGSRRGSIAVVDPRSGEILGLASSPRFDPNHFTRNVSADEWARLARSEEAPLLNRATQATYQPGSVFKVLVALAALEAGVDPEETVRCTGGFVLGKRLARCWKKGGHGSMSMVPAIAHSCNVYFYTMGLRAGIERLARISREAGLGRLAGLPGGAEQGGVIPSPEWRRERGLGGWTRGDTINVAIGQGEVLVTPLQMARAMGALENDGVLMKPQLVRNEGGRRPEAVEQERLSVTRRHLEVVRAGMKRAVARGTAARTRLKGVEVYGKTGSAQNPGGRTHAWFSGVMRAPRGPVALAVCLENAGAGGREAAPVAKRVFQALLDAGWDQEPGDPAREEFASEPETDSAPSSVAAAAPSTRADEGEDAVGEEELQALSGAFLLEVSDLSVAEMALATHPFLGSVPGSPAPTTPEVEAPPPPPPPPPLAPSPPPRAAPRPKPSPKARVLRPRPRPSPAVTGPGPGVDPEQVPDALRPLTPPLEDLDEALYR